MKEFYTKKAEKRCQASQQELFGRMPLQSDRRPEFSQIKQQACKDSLYPKIAAEKRYGSVQLQACPLALIPASLLSRVKSITARKYPHKTARSI